MECAKDEIFEIVYTTGVNRINNGDRKWTSIIHKFMKKHKLITATIFAFIFFSVLNTIMICSFMNILQKI